jgi:hypothetical protein
MVAPRKKTSGFSAKPLEKTEEEAEIDTPDDMKTHEVSLDLETEETISEVQSLPVTSETIIPTEDFGPRFVTEDLKEKKQSKKPALLTIPKEPPTEEVVEDTAVVAMPQPLVIHPPKRSPRNIPKFSRYK